MGAFPAPGRIVEFLRRATVEVRSDDRRAQGSGSGVVLAAGQIVTNAHVLVGPEASVETWDGTRRRARVVRKNRGLDLALLEVEGIDAPPGALTNQEAKAGAAVIAVGNPLGFVGAVSTGFVRAVGSIRELGWRRWVQADVRLAPGNSGGPLANVQGQIVGINTMVVSGGLALAIPAATVQRFLSAKAQRELGVTVRPVTLRAPKQQPRQALLILELARSGAAERASLLPGDVLIEADGKALETPDDLAATLANGATMAFAFHRAGDAKVRRVMVELGVRQASAA